MTLALVSNDPTTSSETSATTSHTFDLPTMQENDWLLAIHVVYDDNFTVGLDHGDTKWNQWVTRRPNGFGQVFMAFRKVDSAYTGETTDTFTTTESRESATHVYHLRGAGNLELQPPRRAHDASAATTSPNPPLVTTGYGNVEHIWIAGVWHINTGSTSAAPTGYSNLASTETGGTLGVGLATAVKTSTAASEDPDAFTWGTSRTPGLFTIGIPTADVTTQTGGTPEIVRHYPSPSLTATTSHSVDLLDDLTDKSAIIIFAVRENTSSVTITTPSGWTKLGEDEDNDPGGPFIKVAVFYRNCDGTEGSSVTITTDASQESVSRVVVLADTDFSTNAPTWTTNPTSATSTTVDPPSISVSSADYLILSGHAHSLSGFREDDAGDYPTWQQRHSSYSGLFASLVAQWGLLTSITSEDPDSYELRDARNHVAFTIAVGAGEPPSAPTNPSATAISSSRIDVSWSDVVGETGYKVERSLDGSTGWTNVSGSLAAGTTSYSNTGLNAETTYYYRVIAFNGSGDSDPSSVVNATTLTGNFGDTDIDVGAGFGGTIFSPGSFQSITTRIRRMRISRGRQHELDRFEAGTATVTLDNLDGDLTPGNTASSFYPDVVPMVAMKLEATHDGTTYPLFYGYVERWPPSYPGSGHDAVVDVELVDLFKILAQRQINPEGASATRDTLIDSLNPAAYWRMSGSATTDDSGNSHTLTWNGTPTTGADGKWSEDESVDLDGTDDYATVASPTALTSDLVGADFSIEAWFYVGAGQTGNHIVVASVNGSDVKQYALQYDADAEAIKGRVAAYGIGGTDRWYHAVVTMDWDATSLTYTERLYVDGGLRATAPLVTSVSAGTLNIGRDAQGTDDYFNGNISEVGIFDVVLTDAQVEDLHASQADTPPEERSDQRITRLLGFIGFTDTDFQTGQTTMGVRDYDGSILDEIQVVADTEDGQFFMAADGSAVFHDRFYRIEDQATPTDVFDSAAGSTDLPFFDFVGPQIDDDLIYNEITITPDNGEPATVEDTTSQNLYGERSLSKTVNPQDPNSAFDLGNWYLQRYATPRTRIALFTIRLGKNSSDDLWASVLGAEIGNRYTIKAPLAGDDLNADFFLEHIQMDVEPGKWVVTWELSPAPEELTEFWILGDATYGLLGDTTILGF